MGKTTNSLRRSVRLAALCGLTLAPFALASQQSKPADKNSTHREARAATVVVNPAQIELLETRVRFAASGDSRKEVHARVKIKNELGVRQFARLNFDYNRRYQQVAFPLLRITHGHGGTSDVLPGAIADEPDPATSGASGFEDLRRKSVRVLGLQPGDEFEYRVVTTEKNGPLAPEFWAEHTFDRTGVVTREVFELDVPAGRKIRLRVSQRIPAATETRLGERNTARVSYRWHHSASESARDSAPVETADIAASTYYGWRDLLKQIDTVYPPSPELAEAAASLTKSATTDDDKAAALYDFVATQIHTVDLPFGSDGFRLRSVPEVIASKIATPEEKCALLAALENSLLDAAGRDAKAGAGARTAVVLAGNDPASEVPHPSLVLQILTVIRRNGREEWLDPAIEVAPYGMIPSELRGKAAAILDDSAASPFVKVTSGLPFAASQRVDVDATLTDAGEMRAKVQYKMRGDSELLLRVAFHQAPKEKWKDLATLLALSDGFRDSVTSASASDPLDTHEAFRVEYEIAQPKFVDWSTGRVRLRALLPQASLPDASTSGSNGDIELGTPLDVELAATLHVPEGTRVLAPTGISVERDYAAFSSKYAAEAGAIHASRHLSFLLREIPASRLADYLAFTHAVQGDEAQDFVLERAVEKKPGGAATP